MAHTMSQSAAKRSLNPLEWLCRGAIPALVRHKMAFIGARHEPC